MCERDDFVALEVSNHDARITFYSEYFAKLDGILRKAVAEDVYDLFQRKLRDRALMRDPNFKWCYKVSDTIQGTRRQQR